MLWPLKSGECRTVGHIRRKISSVYSIFIRHGGAIYCTVNGQRHYSKLVGELFSKCFYCTVYNKNVHREICAVVQIYNTCNPKDDSQKVPKA